MESKNSILNYFKYFYDLAGSKLYLNFGASVLMSILDSLGIGFIVGLLQIIIDPATESNHSLLNKLNVFLSWFGYHDVSLRVLFGAAIFVFLFKSIVYYVQLRVQSIVNSKIIRQTRLHLLSGLTGLSYEKFTMLDGGTIQNVSSTEINRLNSAMQGYLHTIEYLLMSLSYVIIALVFDFQFASIVIISGMLFLLIYKTATRRISNLSKDVSQGGNQYNGLLSQFIFNYKYLKVTDTIRQLKARIIREINYIEENYLKIWKIHAFTSSIREPLVLLIVGTVLFIQYRINGQLSSYTVFTLVLFYRTLNFILLTQSHWQGFNQYRGSVININDLQRTLDAHQENYAGLAEFGNFSHSIVLSNIDLTLNSKPILKNINLALNKNKIVAIVGKSGHGKSTLAGMIAGLYKPSNGSVAVDGLDIQQININSYRQKVGFVTQDPVIFNDSIYNNVTLWDGKSCKDNEKFHEVVRLTKLTELIESSKDKAQTILGDNGIIISGGQKQRIAIARELYKDVSLLILDEATSSLDSETEKDIQSNLQLLKGRQTMVIIAHRLSTIRQADNIVLMAEGEIAMQGNFDQLTVNSPEFEAMLASQLILKEST